MKRHSSWITMLVPVIALIASAVPAHAVKAPVVTGQMWLQSSPEEQKAFLAGMAVIIDRQYQRIRQREQAAMQQGRQQSGSSAPSAQRRGPPGAAINYPSEDALIVDIVDGMNPYTLEQVRGQLTQWYQAHPDQLQTPVPQVIWEQMALPNLRAQHRVQ